MLYYINQTPLSSCSVEGGSGDETKLTGQVSQPAVLVWGGQAH